MSRKAHLFEAWLPFLPEGCDAPLQFGAACDRQSGEGFKGALDLFTLGGVDQHFGDRGCKRATGG